MSSGQRDSYTMDSTHRAQNVYIPSKQHAQRYEFHHRNQSPEVIWVAFRNHSHQANPGSRPSQCMQDLWWIQACYNSYHDSYSIILFTIC